MSQLLSECEQLITKYRGNSLRFRDICNGSDCYDNQDVYI